MSYVEKINCNSISNNNDGTTVRILSAFTENAINITTSIKLNTPVKNACITADNRSSQNVSVHSNPLKLRLYVLKIIAKQLGVIVMIRVLS